MQNEERQTLDAILEAGQIDEIVVDPSVAQMPRLATLLKKWCFVKIIAGCTMRDLLCNQFGISPEYVRKDIKVIFLNFSPVDDIETAIIKDGAIIALSAAMPGLVGAAMRRDGLSWMRTSITYHEESTEHEERAGLIHIKLFNQVMADLGESFLRRGVYVKAPFLTEFVVRFGNEFWEGTPGISVNGEHVDEKGLLTYLEGNEAWVRFSIR